MKILHIINSLDMGGAQSLLVEMATEQIKSGIDVSICILKTPTDKTLLEKVKSNGILVISLSDNRSVRNPLNIIGIYKIIREYDVIHSHLFPSNYWLAFAKLLSLKNKVHIVTTEHSTDNRRRRIWIFKHIESFVYSLYDIVITCSDKAQESFVERYKSIKAISIPNGINLEKFSKAKAYSKCELLGLDSNIFIVTMVARFIPSKRHDTVVEALSLLPQDIHVAFVGGVENEKGVTIIKNISNKLHVENRVHFLYTRYDVPQILKSSDAIVLSSEYEGLSLSSIEGMASGKPFIASRVRGLEEVVEDAGILVECGNSKELAKVISQLKDNRIYYESVCSSCIKRAEKYSINSMVAKYNNIYDTLIKGCKMAEGRSVK